MYTAILYHNTGFSGNNIPADVSVLTNCAKKIEQKTLNIVQNYPLTYIDIHGKFNDYKDVDYIKSGNMCMRRSRHPCRPMTEPVFL